MPTNYYVFQVTTTVGKVLILLISRDTTDSREQAFSTIVKYLTFNGHNAISITCMSDSAIMV